MDAQRVRGHRGDNHYPTVLPNQNVFLFNLNRMFHLPFTDLNRFILHSIYLKDCNNKNKLKSFLPRIVDRVSSRLVSEQQPRALNISPERYTMGTLGVFKRKRHFRGMSEGAVVLIFNL